ncbi:hypothetical protein GCM10023069_39930 [Shinella granuli]
MLAGFHDDLFERTHEALFEGTAGFLMFQRIVVVIRLRAHRRRYGKGDEQGERQRKGGQYLPDHGPTYTRIKLTNR